jgi:hypothetical protein
VKYLNASEAAKLAGISKATMCRALKSGKLSYISIGSEGYKIELSELSRVYDLKQVKQNETGMKQHETPVKQSETVTGMSDDEVRIRELEKDYKHLEEKQKILLENLEKAEGYISAWQKQANQLLLQAPSTDRVKAPPEKEAVEDREELIKRVQRETIKQHKEYLTKNNLLNESPFV